MIGLSRTETEPPTGFVTGTVKYSVFIHILVTSFTTEFDTVTNRVQVAVEYGQDSIWCFSLWTLQNDSLEGFLFVVVAF